MQNKPNTPMASLNPDDSLYINKVLVIIGTTLMATTTLISLLSRRVSGIDTESMVIALLLSSPYAISYLLFKFSLHLKRNHGSIFILINIAFLFSSFALVIAAINNEVARSSLGFGFAFIFVGVPQFLVLILAFIIYVIIYVASKARNI